MAISHVGTGTFTANANAISVPYPAGGASGDLILVFVSTANQAPASVEINAVAMTAVGTPPGTGTAGQAGAVMLRVYRAWRGSTDYNCEIADSGSYQAAVMVYLRGVDTTTPISGTPATRVDASATSTVTWPSPGTPTSGQWAVQAISLDQDATNANYDTFSTSPSFLGYVVNLIKGGTTFDTGQISNAGSGGGLWAAAFDTNYSVSGGTYTDSTTHAQMAFLLNPLASQNATLTTTTGDATAAGGSGSMTGTTNGTLTTTTGDASAAGGSGSLTGTASVTLETTTGDAAAAGGTGSIYAAADATLTTTTGDAAAGGGSGALKVSASATGGSASGTGWVNPSNAAGAPDDSYATWTSSEPGGTSEPLIVSGFGTWAGIPDGSTIDSVEISVQHHESAAGSPIDFVSAQAYLGGTALGTPTNLTLSETDRDDVITPALSLAELQSNTLAVRIIGDRV